jgi:hypothetical protein
MGTCLSMGFQKCLGSTSALLSLLTLILMKARSNTHLQRFLHRVNEGRDIFSVMPI